MLTDFREEDAPLRCEGAIVGSGAAGLSLARQLLADGRSVLMLECGGTAYTAAAAALNDGRNVGHPYHDLEDARLRFFGGTAAILGGCCAELDATDFERREWLARSGWPFPKAAPARWYDAARATLDLASPVARGDAESLGFDSRDTALLHWQFDDRSDRLGFAANQDLIRHPRLRGLLNATVTEVLLVPHATTAAGLCIATLDARLGHVEGRSHVLAAGGLENPRHLVEHLHTRVRRAPDLWSAPSALMCTQVTRAFVRPLRSPERAQDDR